MDAKVLLILAGLLPLSMAQCTGTLRNDTTRVSVSWNVVSSNSVEFTYSAPSNASQYTILIFSATLFTTVGPDLVSIRCPSYIKIIVIMHVLLFNIFRQQILYMLQTMILLKIGKKLCMFLLHCKQYT